MSIGKEYFEKKLQCGDKWPKVPVKKNTLQLNRLGKRINRSYKKCRAYSNDAVYYQALGHCSGGECWRGKYDKGAYQKAATLGSYEACDGLCKIYTWNPEIKNEKNAAYWLHRAVGLAQSAAVRDDLDAMLFLGYVHLFGNSYLWTGCALGLVAERDGALGIRYLERVLVQGDDIQKNSALYALGVAYSCGLGVEMNEQKAEAFFAREEDNRLIDVVDQAMRSARKESSKRMREGIIKYVKERLCSFRI